jgi:NAD(P)-dependent dehydrogenase (short-subunit alcohol dehydrogenase family)/acyl carrier protein
VAALTALSALDRCARLAAGEWLLVHGGAGGVGLAALQIALRRGARVIATAGREDKRALLRALGAEHVLSSRSLAFHDEVRRLVPAGVDVVLNSLAGEAMEQSLALVRPFGRFVELGKRDFYANTRIGLRPFRNNVSYHGVDVDQLLSQAPATAKALMDEIGAMIAEGSLAPLPYQSFAAGEVVDAFRLMQQSGHIGKIVIEPPALPSHLVEPQSVPFRAAGDGVHVIIGGLGGFGLRTAEWLADSGARALALVSRSGAPRAVDGEVLERLRRRGVEIAAVACDAADRVALARTLAGIRAGRPIRGVVHAAMVLDDGALANQTRERMAPVIAAKVAIADNLDALTADDRLDYFLLYSSIAALIGNPGQAAYAAANGYLEGLARRRVADGRPALAVGWGPIADAGYLARNGAVLARLGERTSAIAMTAAEALAALGEVMVRGSAGAGGAVVTIGELGSWAGAARLPVLASPTFSKLADLGRQSAAASDRPVDLAALVAGLDGSAALARVVAAIRPVLASVLKLEAESLDAGRPLSELGVDSLITVELGLEIEQRLGVDLAASAISVGATLKDLAVHILRRVAPKASAAQPAEGRPVDEALALLRRHTSGLPVDADLAPVLNEVEDRRQRLQKVL